MSDSQIHLQPIELSLLNDYYKDFEMDPDISLTSKSCTLLK